MRRERVALTNSVQELPNHSPTIRVNREVETLANDTKVIYHYKVSTKGSNLHVRSGPSTSYSILTKMPNGTKFDVIEIKNGWGKHTYNGKTGWSSLSYATKTGETKNGDTTKTNTTSKASKYTDITELSGTIDLREPIPTIKAKSGVTLTGLGKQLSGLYFVEEVTHKFTSSGYSQSIKVTREWKGESMKHNMPTTTAKPSTPSTNTSTSKPQVTPPKQTKTHTVKKGDTLWALSKKYYGKGSDYMKIFNANKDKLKDPNKIYVGQVLTIP